MEPVTLFTITGLAALSVALIFSVRQRMRNKPSQSNIADARNRAAEKARIRAYAPTQPFDDFVPILSSVEATEICDKYDGRGELTDEQRRIIDLVMNDVEPDKVETIVMPDPWKGRE